MPAIAHQIRLHQQGWRTVFDRRQLVRSAAADNLATYLRDRRVRATAVLGLWRTGSQPLTARRLGWRRRFALTAVVAPYLAGIRQLLYVVVALVVVLSGVVPFAGSPNAVLGLWLPSAAGGVLIRRVAAGGTMATGDWLRQAWRGLEVDLGAIVRAVLGGGPTTHLRRIGRVPSKPAWSQLRLLTVMVVVIDMALAGRALTFVVPGFLPPLAGIQRFATIAVLLLQLAVIVDVSQVVIRRPQRREGAPLPDRASRQGRVGRTPLPSTCRCAD